MTRSVKSNNTIYPPTFSLHFSYLNQMAMVIEALPFPSHVCLSSSNQYILANLSYARLLGFQRTKDVTKITYPCMLEHRKRCIEMLDGDLEKEVAYQYLIQQANEKTITTRTPYHFEVCTLFPTGFIYIGTVQKIPLLGSHRNVEAILTISQDTTAHTDLIDLYHLYQNHYHSGKQAITQFIEYLGLDGVFNILPTHRELLTLLMLRKDVRAKYVARQLTLSDRTVEEYKTRLRYKLKHTTSLESLLLKLRCPAVYIQKDL